MVNFFAVLFLLFFFFGVPPIIQKLEKAGIIREGTSKRLFSPRVSDPEKIAFARKVIVILLGILFLVGLALWIYLPPYKPHSVPESRIRNGE